MAEKPNSKPESVLFNVFYEDGTQISNRRVPGNLIGQLDAEQRIQAYIEQQDEEIAQQSGKQRGPIARIAKVVTASRRPLP
jgi:hypothetical protein